MTAINGAIYFASGLSRFLDFNSGRTGWRPYQGKPKLVTLQSGTSVEDYLPRCLKVWPRAWGSAIANWQAY